MPRVGRGARTRSRRRGYSMRCAVALLGVLWCSTAALADRLVLVAGGGTEVEKVAAARAKLVDPFAVDFDAKGNMYMVELLGERALKVGPDGVLTIFAGTGKKGQSGNGGPAR